MSNFFEVTRKSVPKNAFYERIYDEHISRQYGFWRSYVERVIYRYLDCGDLHNGFARVKGKDCGHTLKGTREYLLASPASAATSVLRVTRAL